MVGLLQCEDYARVLLPADGMAIEARLKRQQVLNRQPPPRVRIVLGESVLARRVGSREVMRAQCAHLLEVSQLENVTLQIAPTAHYRGVSGSFSIATQPTGDQLVHLVEVGRGHRRVSYDDLHRPIDYRQDQQRGHRMWPLGFILVQADDLEYMVRTHSGCISPHMVSRLVESGHLGEVEFQARRGEWFCAREWARLLGEQGRHAEALEVLAPYVATGWWEAAETTAELLEGWGRFEEAIELARPYAEAGDRCALVFFGPLLARHGRGDEAVALLRPYIGDWFVATALVKAAGSAGLDEDAAALLAARIDTAEFACDDPSCDRRNIEPSNAIDLLAGIRERQGRLNEAITLLRRREVTSVNGRDQLADLLARHDRIAELRAYAETEFHGHAAQSLAEFLEERGDVEGAIAVYRRSADSPEHRFHGPVHLAELLVRHGRGDEATEVIRSLADSPGGAEDWIVHMLCTLYADQGRPEDGLAYLDSLKARRGEEEWLFFQMRLPLMVACGRREEAIKEARAHPEGGTSYAASAIAGLLAGAGRTEEAVAVLERQDGSAHALAEYLFELGRIEDAVAVLQQSTPGPIPSPWTDALADEPPF
ncbi:hypothetical protein GCM10023085_38730 [Actinomadura viridis]|uniref:Tetratricopeptide (TPR) repeat protein n=1 Tax=Actinomadura viridis TaxID=58110 RepID=A0A931GM62_9ACTN|nr:tetratricopeptide (TPR) repeat protein [Actinomadura viridis]